jgi:hypothetical protein
MEFLNYDWLNFILPFLFGMLGFLVCMLGKRLAKGAVIKEQHRRANDRVMELIHSLARAKNDVMLIEMEIQEALETLPVDRARWLVEMRQLAHSVPPLVLAQIKRFGLWEPPPDLAGTVSPNPPPGTGVLPASTSRPRLVVPMLQESAEPTSTDEVAVSAWGGRVASG